MLKMPQIVREIRIVAIIMTFANTLNAPLVAGSPSKRPCENGRSVCFAYIDMAGEVVTPEREDVTDWKLSKRVCSNLAINHLLGYIPDSNSLQPTGWVIFRLLYRDVFVLGCPRTIAGVLTEYKIYAHVSPCFVYTSHIG